MIGKNKNERLANIGAHLGAAGQSGGQAKMRLSDIAERSYTEEELSARWRIRWQGIWHGKKRKPRGRKNILRKRSSHMQSIKDYKTEVLLQVMEAVENGKTLFDSVDIILFLKNAEEQKSE